MKTKTTLSNFFVSLSQNSSTANVTLGNELNNDSHRYLMQKYFFNERTHTINTVAQQQAYNLPYNYSKLKTGTLTIGNLKWNPTEILTRREWDDLNVFPYYADIPNNFFIYNNKFELWPIPSTSGNIITFNYQIRVPDLVIDDYSTGTVSATNESYTITGSGTSWLTTFSPTAGSALNQNLWIRITEPNGDGNWYQIDTIDSNTSITLMQPYAGNTVAGANYVIGQMPLLLEDFHDLIVYRSLVIYYSSINKDMDKKAQFEKMYNEGIKMMDEYVGSKSLNVNLGRTGQIRNPNLYWQG